MRLSQYAKQMNVSYKTAFRWWRAGRFDAYQLDTGTSIIRDPLPETNAPKGIALYARVSTQGQKADLDRQVERLKTYAASRGYQVTKIVQKIASGVKHPRIACGGLVKRSDLPSENHRGQLRNELVQAQKWAVEGS